MKNITVPVDERNGRPKITNKMKAECCGDFSFEIEMTCFSCAEIESQDECEVCGDGSGDYIMNVDVPWTLCKDIYKKMAEVAKVGEVLP